MMDTAKQDRIIKHLGQTLNATRDELKGLAGILNDKQFDIFIAEIGKKYPNLCVKEPGAYTEWYFLRRVSLNGRELTLIDVGNPEAFGAVLEALMKRE
jgi:hypothetical protein